MYVFMSFASALTGTNIGCCIVEVDDPDEANQKCKDLGLMPNEPNYAKGYPMGDVNSEDMEVGKFYTREQMVEMHYHTVTEDAPSA